MFEDELPQKLFSSVGCLSADIVASRFIIYLIIYYVILQK